VQAADTLAPVEAAENVVARPGLRERKKQQTRDRIARVGLELFAERGYEQTTLAEIADAADVSTRTIFAYFESKEEILFCDDAGFYDSLKAALDNRGAGVTTVDALREYLRGIATEDDSVKLRKKIIGEAKSLRLAERARFAQAEELIAESIARDLDSGPGDIRPALVAASMTAGFTTMRDRIEAESGKPLSHEQAMAALDEVLDFVRGGLEELRRA
jgi:AcrR family transcriptional regulator